MADSEDMKRLTSGELDVSRCDFREADLSGMDLHGRDFTHALLERAICHGTNFGNCDFRNATFSFAKAVGANFDNCNLQKLHFGYADLSNSILTNVSGEGARFQHAKLNGADIRGSTFSGGAIDADTTLTGVVSDNATNFEGLKVLRPTARDPLFKEYEFNKGQLKRKNYLDLSINENTESQRNSISHSDGTRFSDGSGYAAPAADRIVAFNHNDPEYTNITKEFDDVIELLRISNDHIENRDTALQSLRYAKSLWNRAQLPLMHAKIGIIMALDDAINLIGTVTLALAIEVLKTSVADYIAAAQREKWQIIRSIPATRAPRREPALFSSQPTRDHLKGSHEVFSTPGAPSSIIRADSTEPNQATGSTA